MINVVYNCGSRNTCNYEHGIGNHYSACVAEELDGKNAAACACSIRS